MIFSIIQASIKATVDEAMKEIFKELNNAIFFGTLLFYTSPKKFA